MTRKWEIVNIGDVTLAESQMHYLIVEGRTVVAHALPVSDQDDGGKNAALIVAAPEMYALLERVLDCRTMGFGRMPPTDEIAAVIDKARGASKGEREMIDEDIAIAAFMWWLKESKNKVLRRNIRHALWMGGYRIVKRDKNKKKTRRKDNE